jgi:hypothetical protein
MPAGWISRGRARLALVPAPARLFTPSLRPRRAYQRKLTNRHGSSPGSSGQSSRDSAARRS